jgi:hypothetical protein
VGDGAHLGGVVAGRDDVDAGDAHQQHVGGAGEQAGDLAFQALDFQPFSLPVGLEVGGDPAVM